MEYITAGESHGPKLTAIVSGVPAGLEIDIDRIDYDLARRQSGYGRGARQMIERDKADFTGGVRFGFTTGAPVSIEVENRDWKNWTDRMARFGGAPEDLKRELQPRPGHADLVGVLRNDTADCRNILERSSARETAARVAACGVAKELLRALGVQILSYVVSIGDVSVEDGAGCGSPTDAFGQGSFEPEEMEALHERIESSETRCPDVQAPGLMKSAIDKAKSDGESLGGTFRVIASGLVPGLGSYASGTSRLTSRLAAAVCSIPAIKGVEFGMGFESARRFGSDVHDPIAIRQASGPSGDSASFTRISNNAGGLEGGMTTGLPLVVTAAMKPIPTLMTPLGTVRLDTLEDAEASRERSDTCAVPAAAVVAEGEVAMVLANAYLEAFGCTNRPELMSSLDAYRRRILDYAAEGCDSASWGR